MNRVPLIALCLVFLASCHSNPYPSGSVSNIAPAINQEVQPAYGINVESILAFEEGTEASYPVTVSVASGKPVVQWVGLPAAAVYNSTDNTIKWKPSFTDGNDPTNDSVKIREYPVTIILKSDSDPITSIRKVVTLKVIDTPRAFTIEGSDVQTSIDEGEQKEMSEITLSSDDYPQGPFNISLKKGTASLKLVETSDPVKWKVVAGPFSYSSVRSGDSDCSSAYNCVIKYEDKVIAFTPDGRKAEFKVSFKLRDKRNKVKISLPNSLDVSGDLGVSFTALDPNEEIVPVVSISTTPEVGVIELKVSTDANASQFESRHHLSWTKIPADAIGKTYEVGIRACNSTRNSSINTDACEEIKIKLSVTGKDVVAPEVARGTWTTLDLKYLISEKEFTYPLAITTAVGTTILSQKVVSSDHKDSVSLDNGELKIIPHSAGVKFATVTAINSVGGFSTETFMYEVLPLNWSKYVLLGFAGTSIEFSALEGLLGTSNREFGAAHSERTLLERKEVFVGTQSLSLPNGADEVAYYSSNLKDVFITSPKLANLPANIVNELRSHGVYLAGRASGVTGFVLKDFELTASRDLGAPTGVANLAGSTTSESMDPGLLSMTISSDCTRLFSLFKAGPTPQELLVGVSCTRSNGGQLVVLGFEWADVRVSQPDADLPSQWFKRMMK
jgi:hypothetical protein